MKECSHCPAFIWAPESLASGLCAGCRSGPPEMVLDAPRVFVPNRVEADFQPQVASPRFVLALADRILAAHEVLAHRAERRQWVLTETDYCPLGRA